MKKKVEVLLITNFKNDSRVHKISNSLGSKYDVNVSAIYHKDLPSEEKMPNYTIKRHFLRTKKYSNNLFFQLIKYCEYVYCVLRTTNNLYAVHANDLGTLPAAIILKFLRRTKVIYDAHEYETETAKLKGLRKKLAKLTEKILIKYTDEVITVSASIADEYKRIYNSSPHLIINAPYKQKLEENSDYIRKKFNIPNDHIVFLFQGGFSKFRGIEFSLKLFKSLEKNNIHFVLVGDGELKSEIEKYSQNISNIHLHDMVKHEHLSKITSSADVGIIFYENTCLNHYYCMPNKIFEYLHAEIPTLSSSLFDISKFNDTNQVGWLINSDLNIDNAREIVLNIQKEFFQDQFSEKKKHLKKLKNVFNWNNEEIKLLKIYSNLT